MIQPEPRPATDCSSSQALSSDPRTRGTHHPAPPGAAGAPSLKEAYAFCVAQTRRHYENFPVGSWLLPRRLRPAVHAVYAFARCADDFADEPEHEGSRLQALERWEHLLEEAGRGRAEHPIFVALADTMQVYRLPLQPFRDLLTAFRMDARRTRYESWEDLLSYCRHSANPVGRIMLRLFGHDDPGLGEPCDCLCTALQLTNFWQDLSIDLPRGRCYLPRRDLERSGIPEHELLSRHAAPARLRLVSLLAERTRALYEAARPLPALVGSPLSWELRATLAGGLRVLEIVSSGRHDPFLRRVRLGWQDTLPLVRRFLLQGRSLPA